MPSRPTSSASAAPTSRPRATTTRTSDTSTGCTRFLRAADLTDVTLVGQDWGGLIGLRLVAEQPDRFARVVAANTFLPTGDRPPGDAFLAWQRFSQETPEFPVGRIVNGGCTSDLTEDVIAAYDAPFPDDTYKEGARQFPMLVPTSARRPGHAGEPRRLGGARCVGRRPFLCAFSDQDPITGGADRALREHIPGARGSRTPRSRAAATSSRRTGVRSWRASWSTS